MNVQPLSNRMLVKPADKTVESAGGILLPGTISETIDRGTVIAVGPGKRDANGNIHPTVCAVGDTIIFGQRTGNEISVGGVKMLMMSEDDVFGIIDKE